MTIDWPALGLALLIESLLLAAIALGGPHGPLPAGLGGLVWLFQLPFGLLVLYGEALALPLPVRLAGAVLGQAGLWYLAIVAWRRRGSLRQRPARARRSPGHDRGTGPTYPDA